MEKREEFADHLEENPQLCNTFGGWRQQKDKRRFPQLQVRNDINLDMLI
jgi:hypothetical protein